MGIVEGLIWWRGTLMTREAFELVRMLAPDERSEILARFSTLSIGSVRRIDDE